MSSREKNVYCFSAAMIVALIFHWLSLARGEDAQLSLFFSRFGDFGADFFNQLRYVAERNPYFNNINGPANHFLFLMLEPFQIRIGALRVNHLFLKIAPLCFFLCALVSSARARLSGQARRNANGGKLDTQ